MCRAKHAARVIEKSGRIVHDRLVRVQHFLLENLQRGYSLVERVKILRNLSLLVEEGLADTEKTGGSRALNGN